MTTPAIAIMIAADVADLLGEVRDERLLGRGLGLGRRVGEHRVDALGELIRRRRIGDPEDVPADLIRHAGHLAHRLVQ